jgi:molecular chaperone DnaJ
MKMVSKDYYLILGIERNESSNGIRSAYLRLARKYHPDRVGTKWTAKFRDIVEAYQILSDPQKRQNYNLGLDHAAGATAKTREPIVPNRAPAPEPLVPSPSPTMRDFYSHSDTADSILKNNPEYFTKETNPASQPPKGINLELVLSPEEAMRGGTVPIRVPALYPCPYCDGSKSSWPFSCPACRGRGVVAEEEIIRLRIPSMVSDGAVIGMHLQGLGVHNAFLNVHIRINQA